MNITSIAMLAVGAFAGYYFTAYLLRTKSAV